MHTIRHLCDTLNVSPDIGLSREAAEISRQRYGTNRLTRVPPEPLWRKFLAKFDEPIIKILLAAALLSILVELFSPESGGVGRPAPPHPAPVAHAPGSPGQARPSYERSPQGRSRRPPR